MRRRSCLWRLFETAPLALWVLLLSLCDSWAQTANFRIGVLTPGGTFDPVVLGLKEGMDRLDYRQDKNLAFIVEDSQGAASGLVERARKVLEAKPDVLFAVTTPHAIAAMQATTTVPVVFAWVGDPVRAGLVASYSSSKNNLTGVASYSAAQIEALIAKARRERLPLMVYEDSQVDNGALVSYGGDFRRLGAQAAKLVVKILRGTKPVDLPVETPDRLLLTVNADTAKTIGLKISDATLERADRVVE